MATKNTTPTLDTATADRLYPTRKTLGEYTVELKGFKTIAGHDDSLPYQASVIVNGIKVGTIHNDGWGGESRIEPAKGWNDLIVKADLYLRKNKTQFPDIEMYGIRLYFDSLTYVCDHIASNLDQRNRLARLCKKNLVMHSTKTGDTIQVTFKGTGRESMYDLLKENAGFRAVWNNAVKARLAKGYDVVLNAVPEIADEKVA